jgi:hypothetical protein
MKTHEIQADDTLFTALALNTKRFVRAAVDAEVGDLLALRDGTGKTCRRIVTHLEGDLLSVRPLTSVEKAGLVV